MQLYYMCKDKNSLSESSVVLMTVALIYKFVLVVMGMVMFAQNLSAGIFSAVSPWACFEHNACADPAGGNACAGMD